jgi:hypothetical protein
MTQIITNSMPIGVPGDLSRQQAIVESYQNFVTTPVLFYGLPVKMSASPDSVTGIVAADTSAVVLGFAVRKFYGYTRAAGSESFGSGAPPDGPIDIMKEGYMVVRNNFGTPVKEGAVHVRIAVPSGQRVIGGIEAVADGANTFVLAGANFTGGADSEGNAEIRFRVGNG